MWKFVLGVGLREAEEVVRRFGGNSGTEEGGVSGVDEKEDGHRMRAREVVVRRRWVQIRDMLEGVKVSLSLGDEMGDGG